MIQHITRLTKHSAIYTVTGFAIAGSNTLLLPLFTRYLTPTDYGITATAALITTFLGPLMMLNQSDALGRFYFDHRDNPESLRSYTGTLLAFAILWGCVLSVALVLLGPYLSRASGIPFAPFVLLAVLSSYLGGLTSVKLVLWRARNESGRFMLMRLSVYIVGTLLAVIFVVGLKGGAEGRVWGPFIGTCFGGAISLFLFRKELGRLGLRPAYLKPSLAYGIPLVPHFLFIGMTEFSSRIFLNHFRTLAETGIYSVSYALASALRMVMDGINAAWRPFMYDMASRQGEDAKRVFARLTSYYVAAILALALTLSLFARELVTFLIAADFREAYKVIHVITLALVFKGLGDMVANQLHYMKRTDRILMGSLTAGGTNLLLNWLLIPPYGMIGAAWATVASQIVAFAITWYLSWRAYPIRYEARIAVPMALALPVLTGIYWVEETWSVGLLMGVLVKMGILAAYGGLILGGFLTRSEVGRMLYWGKYLLSRTNKSPRE